MTDFYMQILGQYGSTIPWSFGMHGTATGGESSIASIWHDAWEQAWTDATHGLNTLYPTDTATTQAVVATLNATMHEISKTSLALAHAGTSTADTLPYQEATVVSWRGQNIQRHGRGRIYLPALAEDQVNGDVLIAAAATRVKAAMQAMASYCGTRGLSFFVTNKKPLKDGTPAFQKTAVTTPLVAIKPARQSRRVRKVATSYV